AKKKGDNEALGLMDKMLSFSKHAAARCSRSCAVRWRPGTMRERIGEDSPLSLEADPMSGRRLYGQYLQRSFEGGAGGSAGAGDLARLLQLSEADDEATRVDVCKPLLKVLYLDTLEKAFGAPSGSGEAATSIGKLTAAKAAMAAEVEKFNLPLEVVQKTRKEAYRERLIAFTDTVPTASEKDELDAARVFFELSE
ncbi:unnamed protein product, partial [Prorocentrum cordatum]